MAKISRLPSLAANSMNSTELVPVLKDGQTWGAVLNDLIAPAAQPFVDAAALSAAFAEAFAGPVYEDQAAGEAATQEGQVFRVNNGDGTLSPYLREAAGSTPQDPLASTKALGSPAGAAMVWFKQPDVAAEPLSVADALLAGAHTYNVWFYMTPAMREDALAGTKLLNHSPAFQACINAAVAAGSRQMFVPFSRGQVYNFQDEVNIPRTSKADCGFMIVGDATPRYDPENGGHITGDPALPRLFSYDNFSANAGSNNFTISRINFYSSAAPRTQAAIQFTSRNNGPHRAFQFLESSAKGFDAVYLFDADLPDDPLILSAANVMIPSGCYRGNTDVVRANNRIMGLSVSGGVQSEQGARYSGRISGPITFRDAMLEGQSNVINCDSDAPQLIVEDCYLEQITGDYFARIKGTAPKCSLRVRSNYVSRHQATDFFRVEGCCRILETDGLRIQQNDPLPAGLGPCRAAVSFVGGIAYYGSVLLDKVYVSTEAGGGLRGYLEPRNYQRGTELTNQVLGKVFMITPFGPARYGKQVQGFPASYTNFIRPYAAGDLIVASALVRADGGSPYMAVYDDGYTSLATASGVSLPDDYKGRWVLLHIATRAVTAGTVGRLRFGSETVTNPSAYTLDIAACGFDVIPAANFEDRNGQLRALVSLFNPFDPEFKLSVDFAHSGTSIAAEHVYTTACVLSGVVAGDIVRASYSDLPSGLVLSATALSNSIRFDVINPTGGAINLPAGRFRGVVG